MARDVSVRRAWVLLTVGLSLVGCDRLATEPALKEKSLAPPTLWRAEVVEDSGGQTGVIDICANPELVASFTRVEPRINGDPCLPYGHASKDTPTERIARCQAGGMRYGLYVTNQRNGADDFTVRFALQPLEAAGGKVVQARRYHKLGACPSGWKAGDQGPPAGAPTSNLLNGQKLASR